ncbi:hypothetical protein TNCV_3888691 [Trichonephila clavipes]|nr:hypothetical protein TNCV_3888691 [Trichonephila clavipes]
MKAIYAFSGRSKKIRKDKRRKRKKEEDNSKKNKFVSTHGMPNSSSQMITDRLDWRRIWGSGRPKKGRNTAKTVL